MKKIFDYHLTMSGDKLRNIYKLLTEYNFDINKNVPEEFKCGKCRKILLEACQTMCGCRFCRHCVDEMLNNGCQFCPGITSDCKMELLSNTVIDYRVNKQISKLIMKCPEEMCSFECELIEMSEHLRICAKKSVECPFYKLGCDMRKMTNEKLIEHFQLENYNHNKTLIDMIDNIKNEIEELKGKELKNHVEINKLKLNLQLKNEKLQSINSEMEIMKKEKLEMENRLKNVEEKFNVEITKLKSKHEKEIESIKTEKEELDDQMQIGLRNIWYKIDEIELEMKKKCENGKSESIKSELIEKIEILQGNFDNKIDEIELTNKKEIKSINDEIRLEMMEVCKLTIDKSIMQMGIQIRINQLERNVENKMKGIFEMMIENVDQYTKLYSNITLYYIKHKYDPSEFPGIRSEYFYTQILPYKLKLNIDPLSSELRICLYIYDDVVNQKLPFPFTADVTIKIINKNRREVSKSITKYCQIKKPKHNSFNESDGFIYPKSELIETGILESNCFIVECCVELKYPL